MAFAVQNKADQMYLILEPVKNGFLTWDHEGERYILAFTDSEKAEEYNAVVLKNRPGEIVIIKSREARNFARKMVEKGVYWMMLDHPVIHDNDFWDQPIYRIGETPIEEERHYAIVDLRAIVRKV